MKKRLFSILLALCMVLCLVPTMAFAESETEEPPVCTCETACTAEAMNADCPICGVEGALPENCVKCTQPADDAAVQPEGEVSDPQPETALTALIGGNETAKEVSNESELTAAIADSTVGTVKLAGDISISSSLTVNRTVTLDLNGHVLKYESANKGSVIVVEGSGQLTIEDSNTSNLSHKFNPNGKLWVLDEASGTETVTGGVITGGTGYPFTLSSGTVNCGGGVYIAPGGQLTMTGGNIIGCSAEFGGGVCIYPRQNGEQIQFSMSGGSIIGCVASDLGGGVCAYGTFKMSGPAVIRSCAVESADNFVLGGGVFVDGSFEMSGEATIKGCQAISDFANGGGVFVNSSRSFVMSNEAKIENCQAISNSSNSSKSSNGGGVYLANNTKFTLSGSAVIQNCTATNSANHGEAYGGGVSADCVKEITLADSARIVGCTAANGSGLYITGSQVPGYGILYANGGSVDGDVVLGDTEDGPCTITGSGGTVFNGKVTVTPGSTIESGTFNGEVINNGTITGGVFNNTVSGSGTITGGTFNTPMTGSGTETDPYQISTADQLKLFRDIVNGSNGQTQNRGACAVLTNDIVLNDGTFDENGNYTTGASGKAVETWTPIGKYTDDGNNTPYTGTFDGKHYAIKGLYVVNLPDVAVGLFGGLKGAAVRNLTVDGYVQGCDFVSGIAGDASANSTIENCRNDCHVVSEYGADSGSFLYVGGIVGSAADTTIAGCVNTGVVEARGSNNFGSVAAGIVGILYGNATVINCYNTGEINVTGDKLREGTAGGIAGKDLSAHNTVSDCYNVGAVTVEYTGNSDSYIAMVGGIMGKIFYFDTTVSNCYSVGTLKSTTGTGTSYIGGVVGITKGTVANCYYLDSTAEKAVWPDGGTVDEATGSKTAAQLGNGTVLALLINGRADSEHPWNSQCQYLAAAGKTLPVFKTQTGDEHTHDQSSPWKSNETEHWQVCTCGAVFHKAEHSGGTATCTQRATCTVCGAEYGDALGHDFTTSWTHDDNEHWKQCSRCDEKDDVSPHTWNSGTVTTAPTCTKAGEETYSCTECGATKIEPIPATGHRWKSEWTSDATHHWHECANESCDVTDNAGKNGYAEHSGGKATCKDKAICEICGDSYGSLDPNNHTDLKHIDAKAATAAEEGNIAYWYCDGCKKYFSDAAAIKEITKAATVTAKLPPKITAGDGAAVTQGEKKELTFTSDASFADFVRVELDGTALEEKNYTKREGSTIITLNRDFVAALSVGEHTLAIVSQHGTATAKFTVMAKPTETATPQPTVTPKPTAQPTPTVQPQPTVQPVSPILRTGDTANPALWFALLIVSGGAAIGITVVSRKKKHNK